MGTWLDAEAIILLASAEETRYEARKCLIADVSRPRTPDTVEELDAIGLNEQVEALIRDACLEPSNFADPRDRAEAEQNKRLALEWFEAAKVDVEGVELLEELARLTGRREVDILDGLLLRASICWDIQK